MYIYTLHCKLDFSLFSQCIIMAFSSSSELWQNLKKPCKRQKFEIWKFWQSSHISLTPCMKLVHSTTMKCWNHWNLDEVSVEPHWSDVLLIKNYETQYCLVVWNKGWEDSELCFLHSENTFSFSFCENAVYANNNCLFVFCLSTFLL